MGKVNKSLKAWVAFVKSVQKKYKLSYKDAIHKAKELKDQGANWMSKGLKSMKGGNHMEVDEESEMDVVSDKTDKNIMDEEPTTQGPEVGGRRRRRTSKRRGSKRRRSGHSRSRAFRRTMSRRKSASRKASRSMGLVMGVA